MKPKSFDGYSLCVSCQVRKQSNWTLRNNKKYTFCQNCGKSSVSK